MGSCGTGEIITLVVVAVIIFSASRMSSLGNALGRFVYSFKKASKGEDLVDVTPKRLERASEDAQVIDAQANGKPGGKS
ncbi:MAG: twin-arginine translocase TatA/TatE family subunit [Myxococcota bacterium]